MMMALVALWLMHGNVFQNEILDDLLILLTRS